MQLHSDTFNRLSLGIIEKDKCSPEQALVKLGLLSLNLICSEDIRTSLPLQAALLTAINTGKRAFLGGILVQLPDNVESLLKWPGKKYLNDIVIELGGNISEPNPKFFSLTFGIPALIDDNQMQVVCNNWQSGVLVNGEDFNFNCSGDIPTAGIFAGSLAVFLAFLKMTGINIAACDKSIGISLWRPDLNWLEPAAKGPQITFLPKKYWILGLGHLGQAYIWNIGLLPYNKPEDVSFVLQDDDVIVEANWSAGLLSEFFNSGILKTRVCSRWLETRAFKTKITERRFDLNTKRCENEPYVALCGFDSANSRLHLENAGFDLVVEAGLGDNLSTFDIISMHTFPGGTKTPRQLWGDMDETKLDINESIYNILRGLDESEECGIVPLTISGKSVSASFVGACVGSLTVAELIRGLHGGMRYDKISLQMRNLENMVANVHPKGAYLLEQSRNGFVFFDRPGFSLI